MTGFATRFVDVAALCRIVKSVGADDFMAGIAEALREDFRRWESFEKLARVANHSDIGVIELMPIADRRRYAFKYVNGHPANADKGVSTVMAFGALADVETGFPTLLSELTVTTAFRTAAASAIAAEVLAPARPLIATMLSSSAYATLTTRSERSSVSRELLHSPCGISINSGCSRSRLER